MKHRIAHLFNLVRWLRVDAGNWVCPTCPTMAYECPFAGSGQHRVSVEQWVKALSDAEKNKAWWA